MVKFNGPYDRIREKTDSVKRRSHVDMTGYVPKEKRIRYLIEAGERLRPGGGSYDTQGEVDIDQVFIDPTRQKGFDLVDAQEVIRNRFEPTIKKLQEAQKVHVEGIDKKSTDEEKSKKGDDISDSGKDDVK